MHFSYTKMNNLGVIRLKKMGLLMLVIGCLTVSVQASKISVRYEKPVSAKYEPIYKTLKSNHRRMLGESVRSLRQLYDWPNPIQVVVASCGFVNSRYQVGDQVVVICYESLYNKIYDYPQAATSKRAFANRVFQNTMFTFWHEMGHALIDQLGLIGEANELQSEIMADEFAALSMIWRGEQKWNHVLMISALHFKSKSTSEPGKSYKNHPDDDIRYQKMIVLLHGSA